MRHGCVTLLFSVLLIPQLFLQQLQLRGSDDAIRRNLLRGRLFWLPRRRWGSFSDTLLRLTRWIPFARRNRCLVASLAAFHYLRCEPLRRLEFFLGVATDPGQTVRSLGDGSSTSPILHAWVEFEWPDGRVERFDTSESPTTTLFSYAHPS